MKFVKSTAYRDANGKSYSSFHDNRIFTLAIGGYADKSLCGELARVSGGTTETCSTNNIADSSAKEDFFIINIICLYTLDYIGLQLFNFNGKS